MTNGVGNYEECYPFKFLKYRHTFHSEERPNQNTKGIGNSITPIYLLVLNDVAEDESERKDVESAATPTRRSLLDDDIASENFASSTDGLDLDLFSHGASSDGDTKGPMASRNDVDPVVKAEVKAERLTPMIKGERVKRRPAITSEPDSGKTLARAGTSKPRPSQLSYII